VEAARPGCYVVLAKFFAGHLAVAAPKADVLFLVINEVKTCILRFGLVERDAPHDLLDIGELGAAATRNSGKQQSLHTNSYARSRRRDGRIVGRASCL